jgi:hypothetical protein
MHKHERHMVRAFVSLCQLLEEGYCLRLRTDSLVIIRQTYVLGLLKLIRIELYKENVWYHYRTCDRYIIGR